MEDDKKFLNYLVGRWQLTGKMGDVDLHQEVSAKWILGEKFLWMHFKSNAPEGNRTSNYEAVYHIGFNEEEEVYVMHLLDTTEVPTNCVVGLGKREDNSIPFLFEYEDIKFFNIFIWSSDEDSWTFDQMYEEGGEMKTFAKKKMVRKSG